MKFKHDASVFPSAPMVDAVISSPDGGKSAMERALIDTGASVTVISERLATKLGLIEERKTTITGVFGKKKGYVYSVNVAIGGVEFASIKAVSVKKSEVLIGRNLINLWRMTLDGESETIDIREWTRSASAIFLRRRRAGP